MTTRANRDDKPHMLIIDRIGDGREQDVEWRIVHPPTCSWEAWPTRPDSPFGHGDPSRRYDFHRACLTQYEIDNVGLDSLDGWEALPAGRYRLTTTSVYYPGEFGGSYGEEWGVEMSAERADAAADR